MVDRFRTFSEPKRREIPPAYTRGTPLFSKTANLSERAVAEDLTLHAR